METIESIDSSVFGKLEIKINKLGSVLLQSICLLVVTFAVLRLIASIFVMKSSLCGILTYGFVIALLWIIFEYAYIKFSCFCRRYEIFFLMGVCLLVHLFLIGILPSLGRNEWATCVDFQYAVKSLLAGKICHIHRDIYTYWCNYEIILSSFGVLFGGRLEVGQIVNACSCVIVIGFCFALVKCIAGVRTARLTTLVLGLSPVLVMGSTLLTGEFLSAMFMFIAFCCLYYAAKEAKGRAIMILCSGCALGISYLFKTITIVFVIAIIVLCVLYLLYVCRKESVIRVAVVLLLLLPSYYASRHIGQKVLSEFVSSTPRLGVRDTGDTLLYELALGFNIPSGGKWEQNLAVNLKKMTTEEKIVYLKNAIARDWKGYPLLMVRKFVNLHGSHNERVGITQQFTDYFRKKNDKAKGWRDYWIRYTPKWIEPLSDAGMIVFEILFLFGSIGLLLSLKKQTLFWMPGVLAGLIVIGFAIIEQMIEVAGRYKIGVYPFYFMILPYVCVWFEKDNPVYVRMAKWGRRLMLKLKRRENEC